MARDGYNAKDHKPVAETPMLKERGETAKQTLSLTFEHATLEARQEIASFIRVRARNIASWGKVQTTKRDKEKNAAVVTEMLNLAQQIESGEL